MKKIFLIMMLFVSTQLFAQNEQKICEAFLKSVQQKDFRLLKPWLGEHAKALQEKWQQVVNNAHRKGFNIKAVTIKKVVNGDILTKQQMKGIVAVYEYDGKEWDDMLLMVSTDKEMKLVEIPLTSYMFKLDEGRRGRNAAD
jgi:ribosomal protein S1